ncbi:MAG TPA: hypothetical protein VN083_07820, partial [Vicinamibacteria bacterium]|nr:hypothetical protein [Vicinamibacteria bacterium]
GFLDPVFESSKEALAEVFRNPLEGASLEWGLMALSVAVAALGIVVATVLYRSRSAIPARLEAAVPGLYRLLFNKYYVDELYERIFVRGAVLGGGQTFYTVDRLFWDGGEGEVRPGLGVNGVAWAVRDLLARGSGLFDRVGVDGIVNAVGAILDNLSYVFRAVQNGLVQYYALCMVIGFFLMLALAGLRWVL